MERTRWLVRRRQWEAIRQKGWFRHVVLGKSIPATLAGLLGQWLGQAIDGRQSHHHLHETFVVAILVFAGMTAFGAVQWTVNEHRYHQPQDNQL